MSAIAIAVVGVSALMLTLLLRGGSAGPAAVPRPTSLPAAVGAPGRDDVAIRTAMQAFVDAVNSRDVTRIRSVVCGSMRSQVVTPHGIEGNVVLDALSQTTVTGDSAESTVSTHTEMGATRSTTESDAERFTRENGRWLVCPGTTPDTPAIGT